MDFRKMICPEVWGEQYTDGKWDKQVRYCNTTKQVLSYKQGTSAQNWLPGITKKLLIQHWLGKKTIFYTSRGYDKKLKEPSRYICVMLDGDVKKKKNLGTTQGCKLFFDWLKDNYFPGLFIEPSTNGKGWHGYYLLDCLGLSNKQVNQHLRTLQKVLRQLAQDQQANKEFAKLDRCPAGCFLEMIEIKGTCPEYTFEGKRIVDVTFGQLAKVPRTLPSRLDEFDKLESLALNPATIVGWEYQYCIDTATTAEIEPNQVTKLKLAIGSNNDGGRIFSPEQYEATKTGNYFSIAAQLLGTTKIKIGRRSATTADMAIFLMLLEHFSTKGKNDNGAMPFARFENTWQALYRAGDVTRPWDHHRYKALRQYLSDRGLINWIDDTYVAPIVVDDVTVKAGRCCEWEASEELLAILNTEKRKASLAGTDSATDTEPMLIDGPHPLRMLDFAGFIEYKQQQLAIIEHQQQTLQHLGLAG